VENYIVNKKAISCYKLANQQINESATAIRPGNIPGYICKYFKLYLRISTWRILIKSNLSLPQMV